MDEGEYEPTNKIYYDKQLKKLRYIVINKINEEKLKGMKK